MSKTHVFRPGPRRLAAAALLSGVALLSTAACTGSSSAPSAQGAGAHRTNSAAASPSASAASAVSLPSAAAAAASTASSTGDHGTNGGKAATPQCANADLKVSWGYGSQSEPEQYEAIDFVNTSSHACTLYGYPGLVIKVGGTTINAARVLDGAVSPLKSPQLVTLSPGGKAYAIAQWEMGTPGQACYPTGTSTFEATAPNTTRTVVLSTGGQVGKQGVCSGLAVNPVETGTYGLPASS